MTPLEKYQQDLTRDDFSYDSAQEAAVQKLDRLYHDLIDRYENRPRSLWSRISPNARAQEKTPCMGLYFWGGVGRGKTYLVDMANADNRSTYVAVSNTFIGLFMLAAGGVGWLGDIYGVPIVIGVLAVVALAGSFYILRIEEVSEGE